MANAKAEKKPAKAPKAKRTVAPRKPKSRAAASSVGLTAEEVAARAKSSEMIRLEAQIDVADGQVLAAYREPLGGHWVALAALPIEKVKPTPYQRELSKAHADIRMARARGEDGTRSETDVAFELETSSLVTLGICTRRTRDARAVRTTRWSRGARCSRPNRW